MSGVRVWGPVLLMFAALSCGPMPGYGEPTSSGGESAGSLAVNDRVSCNWKGGGTYYDGRIAEIRGSNVFVHYDDGDTEETSPSMCRMLEKSGGGALVATDGSLAPGTRVSCNWKRGGTYYDGQVAEVRPGGRVLINYDDGDVEETTPDQCRTSSGSGAGPSGGGLSGNYAIVSSANPGGGAAYTGTVQISRVGEVYQLAWSIPGTPPYRGVGIEMDGVLAVGWSSGGSPGVVVYRVTGGQLAGKWAAGSGGGLGTENLSGPPGLSGGYQITSAQNPKGGSYTGNVSIGKNGDTHALSWTLPNESYTGIGILRGQVLAVGWGAGGTGVVSYQVNGSRLDGVWADARGGALGSEVLEKR
jgi:hypothetical protein